LSSNSCVISQTRNGLYLTASSLESPNPNCFVCRNATIPLTLNVYEWTFERLLKTVVKGKLGFEAPTVSVDGDPLWEEGDGAESEEYMVNLPKFLADLPCGGIKHGTVFELDDTTQNLKFEVAVTHQQDWPQDDETDDFPFLVGGAPPKAKPATPVDTKLPAIKPPVDDDDDVVFMLNEDEKARAKKRRLEERDNAMPPSKKAKGADDDVIVID
jgi:Ubiquitin/SUMO-activating enzyme ubiquitin-like domain